jgi:hypothetical protein
MKSPTPGTDITKDSIQIIKCHNQTTCILPELQLLRVYKVYYCLRTSFGIRFYFLIKEGLILHPNIHLTSDIDEADIVVYLPVSSPWAKSECADPKYASKLLVLDEGDGSHLFSPSDQAKDWNILYFKRSYVQRHDGKFKGYMNYVRERPKVLPMTYIIAEAYVKPEFTTIRDRDYEIVCTLRGSKHDPTRLRVRQWVEEYAKSRSVQKYIAGQVYMYICIYIVHICVRDLCIDINIWSIYACVCACVGEFSVSHGGVCGVLPADAAGQDHRDVQPLRLGGRLQVYGGGGEWCLGVCG